MCCHCCCCRRECFCSSFSFDFRFSSLSLTKLKRLQIKGIAPKMFEEAAHRPPPKGTKQRKHVENANWKNFRIPKWKAMQLRKDKLLLALLAILLSFFCLDKAFLRSVWNCFARCATGIQAFEYSMRRVLVSFVCYFRFIPSIEQTMLATSVALLYAFFCALVLLSVCTGKACWCLRFDTFVRLLMAIKVGLSRCIARFRNTYCSMFTQRSSSIEFPP